MHPIPGRRPAKLPDRIWLVIAHEAGARIFFRDDPLAPLVLVDRIDWPIGRAKNREIQSDRPGHEKSWGPSKQRHGFDQTVLPTEKNALDLTREIAQKLDRAADLDKYDHLLLVAGPKLLGMIRSELGRPATSRLAKTLDENLGTMSDQEIQQHLARFLSDYESWLVLNAG